MEEHMSRIDVVPDGKKFKILVNFVKESISFNSPLLANKEAGQMHEAKYPHAQLNLIAG